MFKLIAKNECDVIVTTDHGTIKVDEPSKIVGDKNTTTNLRFKQGRNLDFKSKDVLEIKNLDNAVTIGYNYNQMLIYYDLFSYVLNINHFYECS